ncbi:conserved hypothetical protein [Beutenbergia cavernae DSM 12333]|uniref:DUF4352 domain-containing protein n=1 Tax=Beutenbergia cavernae (strain ATCC BAA-8 / DSM 12333 / CCUG 43141 / JCM 11478 / NBRC 16432 / NCIMB 13614 / HKI 0122) TaxID=471853 RepID=C5C071_BEUC1|nr:hypothetical protein [Beutenbergia cavernae]ACQ79257.1 conserved hypothetical protein [Beutenbergia cavernae DSM 12333]
MTGSHTPEAPVRGHRLRWIVLIALVVLLGTVIVVRGLDGRSGTAGAEGSPTSTAGEEGTETPSADPTQDGTPDAADPADPASPEPADEPTPEEVDGRAVMPPAEVDAAVTPAGSALVVRLENPVAVTASDPIPGQLGGPAVQFDVVVVNEGDDELPLDFAVVNVAYGAESAPASDVATGETTPLGGSLEAGETARGTYVFLVPDDQRQDVRVSVDIDVGTPIAVFAGAMPTA